MKKLSEKDLRIIAYLRKDARISLTHLGKKTGYPISTIFDRLKRYKQGLIKKFTCNLDFRQLGFGCHSFVVFNVSKAKRDAFKRFLVRHPNVNAVYRINHSYDCLVEVVFKGMKELEGFVDDVKEKFSVRPRHTFDVVDAIKEDSALEVK